eukprot:7093100-Karenia_brevis.AAC.1
MNTLGDRSEFARGPRGDVCMYCNEHASCAKCGEDLEKETFTQGQWLHRHERGATCIECDKKPDTRESTECSICKRMLPRNDSNKSQWDFNAQCSVCERTLPQEALS